MSDNKTFFAKVVWLENHVELVGVWPRWLRWQFSKLRPNWPKTNSSSGSLGNQFALERGGKGESMEQVLFGKKPWNQFWQIFCKFPTKNNNSVIEYWFFFRPSCLWEADRPWLQGGDLLYNQVPFKSWSRWSIIIMIITMINHDHDHHNDQSWWNVPETWAFTSAKVGAGRSPNAKRLHSGGKTIFIVKSNHRQHHVFYSLDFILTFRGTKSSSPKQS